MAIQQPSQFDCNNMSEGDLIVVRKRPYWYRWYREHFLHNKIKIKVRQDWSPNTKYNLYYQEDCTLLTIYDIKCLQVLSNEVPYILKYKNNHVTF